MRRMARGLQRGGCLLMAAALLLLCASCGTQTPPAAQAFDEQAASAEPETALLAQNERFRLEWDGDKGGVRLVELATGRTWGTSPAEPETPQLDAYGDPVRRHPLVNSALAVNYISDETQTEDTLSAYAGAVKGGRTVCRALEDGLRVEYYFDDVAIMIPVEYRLRDTGVVIRVVTGEIQEGRNKLVSIALAPFFCAAENDRADSWLLVPSGSGALIYPKTVSQQGDSYAAQVYGTDPAIEQWDLPTTEKHVRLPVYGAKSGDTAVCAIIEEGAESAVIQVSSGARAYGYSSVWASFVMRGYTANKTTLLVDSKVKNTIYADGITASELAIGFYPLTGGDATYTGMAQLYRSYLGLTGSATDTALHLNFIGGVMLSQSFLGIPYSSLFAATTVQQAQDITAELLQQGLQPSVQLTGFGKTGLTVSQLAGGFQISGQLGGRRGVDALAAYCADHGVETYVDFDLVNLKRSGNGFRLFFDSAQCASRKIALQYDFDIATRSRIEESRYRLLARDRLQDAAATLLKKTGSAAFTGYSLAALSNTAWSDYSNRTDTAAYAKGAMAQDAAAAMQALRQSGKKLLGSDANAYAAAVADRVTDVPLTSSKERIFDEDIPFYALVFKGAVALAGESVNLAEDPVRQLLLSVESGVALNYTVTAAYDTRLIAADQPVFYGSRYADIRETLLEQTARTAAYYAAVAGQTITGHTILNAQLRMTEFEDGTRVYVNFGTQPQETPLGTVGGQDFIVGRVAP